MHCGKFIKTYGKRRSFCRNNDRCAKAFMKTNFNAPNVNDIQGRHSPDLPDDHGEKRRKRYSVIKQKAFWKTKKCSVCDKYKGERMTPLRGDIAYEGVLKYICNDCKREQACESH